MTSHIKYKKNYWIQKLNSKKKRSLAEARERFDNFTKSIYLFIICIFFRFFFKGFLFFLFLFPLIFSSLFFRTFIIIIIGFGRSISSVIIHFGRSVNSRTKRTSSCTLAVSSSFTSFVFLSRFFGRFFVLTVILGISASIGRWFPLIGPLFDLFVMSPLFAIAMYSMYENLKSIKP